MTPYRVTFVETTYRTLDVLARDRREAEEIAAANTEYALDDDRGGLDIAGIRECLALDFCPIGNQH